MNSFLGHRNFIFHFSLRLYIFVWNQKIRIEIIKAKHWPDIFPNCLIGTSHDWCISTMMVFSKVEVHLHLRTKYPMSLSPPLDSWTRGSMNLAGVQNWWSQIFFKLLHLFVSTREVFPENFSFRAQFSLTLWLIQVLGIVWKVQLCKFLSFSGTSYFT